MLFQYNKLSICLPITRGPDYRRKIGTTIYTSMIDDSSLTNSRKENSTGL